MRLLSSAMQIKGSESQLKPVKDKVRAAVKKRRLRLEEFFEPFDVTRTKKVRVARHCSHLELVERAHDHSDRL